MDDGFDGSKRQRRKPKFSSYTDLNETLEHIYLDTKRENPLSEADKEKAN
jgi:hypothetical protein